MLLNKLERWWSILPSWAGNKQLLWSNLSDFGQSLISTNTHRVMYYWVASPAHVVVSSDYLDGSWRLSRGVVDVDQWDGVVSRGRSRGLARKAGIKLRDSRLHIRSKNRPIMKLPDNTQQLHCKPFDAFQWQENLREVSIGYHNLLPCGSVAWDSYQRALALIALAFPAMWIDRLRSLVYPW